MEKYERRLVVVDLNLFIIQNLINSIVVSEC
jgi:hypothetical protein